MGRVYNDGSNIQFGNVANARHAGIIESNSKITVDDKYDVIHVDISIFDGGNSSYSTAT